MTPLYKIALNASKGEVYAKMEMFNPTGTHKDRSLKPWISHYKNNREKALVISSSGNSAISAAQYSNELGVKLYIFLSKSVDKEKLAKIKKYKNIFLNISKTPKSDAIKFSKKNGLVNLRASVDDFALDGYRSIAYELLKQLPKADNIFVPTSSGTTLEGVYLGYKEKGFNPPSFYAIQTAKVHPISDYFDKDFIPEKTSYASAIVDNISHRKSGIINIIKETDGGGYVISNKELEESKKILDGVLFRSSNPATAGLEHDKLNIGWQSALSFAGFLKWTNINPREASQKICLCLFTD